MRKVVYMSQQNLPCSRRAAANLHVFCRIASQPGLQQFFLSLLKYHYSKGHQLALFVHKSAERKVAKHLQS